MPPKAGIKTGRRPSAFTLIGINLLLWCGLLGYLALDPYFDFDFHLNPFRLYYMALLAALVLPVVTIGQLLVALLLWKFSLNPVARTACFFFPSIALIAIPAIFFRTPEGLVQSTGEFPSPSGSSELQVWKEGIALIKYRIVNRETGRTFESGHRFSDAMRWLFYWESDTRLWQHESDAGMTSLWEQAEDGTWRQTSVYDDPSLMEEMPKDFYDRLGSLTQKDLPEYRSENAIPTDEAPAALPSEPAG